MNDDAKKLYHMVVQCIIDSNIESEEEIANIVAQIRSMPMFKDLTDDDIEQVKAVIMSERSIKLTTGSYIEDKKHEKWFLDKKSQLTMKYWDRYKQYLTHEKGFQIDVVNSMDDILDTLTDLLGDPDKTSDFSRKGLILGDVQSGKTANYTGLICKAADANYKVIILLTGTIEKLRQQTQQRIDEGFVGIDSAAMIKQKDNVEIGVGNYNRSFHAFSLTSTTDDFKQQTARNLNFDLNSINEPVIFVIKKNISILKRLNKWFRTLHQKGDEKIPYPALIIDDEADNASVNVKAEGEEPAAINNQIRQLLDIFTKSSYVGFTATPYANIFIDPETSEQMKTEDLFPKDYIYSLNSPTNYIGARNIFGEMPDHEYMCVTFSEDEVAEIDELLPINHKREFHLDKLPESLKDAVCAFLVANVIRDQRGDNKAHRSMLVNMSRFNAVQQQIHKYVNGYLKELQEATKVYGLIDENKALKNTHIKKLRDIFIKHYFDLGFEWSQIQKNLYASIASIQTILVNQKSAKTANFEDYPNGLRAIMIGGLSLSRGLTLEGLIISYFYRNSMMYDTLMQMGRWFGYRKNYADLCRVWISETSREWYKNITEATDELRRDIQRHEDTGLTPLEFGLRVRSDKTALLVTARNKMRTATSAICTISLSEECIETPDIYLSDDKIDLNIKAVDNFTKKILSENKIANSGKSKIIKDVEYKQIIDLFESIEIPVTNETFDPEVLIEFINQYKGEELKYWDIVYANGSTSEKIYLNADNTIFYKDIAFSVINNQIARLSGSKRRIGTISDGKHGLDGVIDSEIVRRIKEDTSNGRTTIRQKDYFTFRYIQKKRNPQLIIYNVILTRHANSVDEEGRPETMKYYNKKVIGFGIGIPRLRDTDTKYAKYTINKIAQSLVNETGINDDLGVEEY